MSFVGVDVGASGTRFVSNDGRIGLLPNNSVFLGQDTRVDVEPDDSSVENALEMVINKDGESGRFPMHALIGSMAAKYSPNTERPTSMTPKHAQNINYLSIVTAIAVSCLANQEKEVEVYLALPPTEVNAKVKGIVNETLVGNYTVNMPKFNNVTVKFKITNVNCYEESFLAMLSYFFEMDGRVKESSKEFLTGNMLSIDIGASTTDIAVIQNGRYLDMSGQTYKVGGNLAIDTLTELIRTEYGYEMSFEHASNTMAEGRLQTGNTYVEIRDMIHQAKLELAERIIGSMNIYFARKNIPINTFRAIVTSGGGSMESQYIDKTGKVIVTSKPISYYITQMIQEVCSGIEVHSHSDSPRTANIAGLFIRASMNEMKKKKAQAANAVKAEAIKPVEKAPQQEVVIQAATEE